MRILVVGISILLGLVSVEAHAAGKIELHVSLSPVGSFVGKSENVSGQISLLPDSSIAGSNIGVSLDTFTTGIGLRDKHMKETYFETQKFPSAVASIVQAANGKFKANLKIRETEKVIEGTYKISGSDVQLEFQTRMSDFKIKKASYMGVGAENEVKVVALVPAVKGQPPSAPATAASQPPSTR